MVSLGNLVFGGLALALVAVSVAWVVRHYAITAVLRRSARVLRLDGRALAVGLVLLLAAGAGVAAVYDPGAPIVVGLIALLALAGVLGLTVAVANLDWYRAARSLPVRSPADAEPGPVQLEGAVVASGEPVESAVTRTESVAYRAATLEEHAVLGRGQNGSTWSPVSTAFDAAAFAVASGDDDAESPASVAVDAAAASFPLLSPGVRVLGFTPAGGALAGLERTVSSEPGTTAPIGDDLERGARPRPRRYTERRIDPGDDVYVLGTAERTADGLRVVDDPGGPPLLVARLSAADARTHARHVVLGYGALGLLALGAAAALALQLV